MLGTNRIRSLDNALAAFRYHRGEQMRLAVRADAQDYAVLGTLLTEVCPGVFVEASRKPVLMEAENSDGFTILVLCVDKR